jgi:hypothetical protein
MKRNEIIELNGVEYTLELNRESFIQIDKLCNIDKSMKMITKGLYDYLDDEELTDDFDLSKLNVDEDKIQEEVEAKEKKIKDIMERAFLIWLNPNHHLNISQVREILKPYFDDEEKFGWLGEKYGKYLQECVEIREEYNQERKNLKAQANKNK